MQKGAIAPHKLSQDDGRKKPIGDAAGTRVSFDHRMTKSTARASSLSEPESKAHLPATHHSMKLGLVHPRIC